jgi:hypothetical protein
VGKVEKRILVKMDDGSDFVPNTTCNLKYRGKAMKYMY